MARNNAAVFGGDKRGVAGANALTDLGNDLIGGASPHALALGDAEDVTVIALCHAFAIFPIKFIGTGNIAFVILFACHTNVILVRRGVFWALFDTVS